MPRKKYYQRPDGLYETTRTMANGKKVRFRGRSCQEVDRKILEYTAQQADGRTVGEVMKEWLSSVEGSVSRSTFANYGRYSSFLIDMIGDERIRTVTPARLQYLIQSLADRHLAGSTISLYITVIKQTFKHAVLSGDIAISPAHEVSKPRGTYKAERTALTEEQERLVEDCRTGDWWLLGILLLFTGLRRGEALALTWQDFDFRHNIIHVNKKLNWYTNAPTVEPFLKNAQSRDVPILAPLAAVLPKNRIGVVFPNDNGGYMTKSQLQNAWCQYCRDAGLWEHIEYSDGSFKDCPTVTMHQFRHSFATICYESGIDPRAAANLLGDTVQVTEAVYTELRQRRSQSSVDAVSNYIINRRRSEEERQA